jgi:hypothetical protein
MMILNLTQHTATPEQVAAGVIEPENKEQVVKLLTFDTLPSPQEIWNRAKALAQIAKESSADSAMIGGAPYFMSALEDALIYTNVIPVYSFSVRESQEVVQPDGTVRKVSIFKHSGFARPSRPSVLLIIASNIASTQGRQPTILR